MGVGFPEIGVLAQDTPRVGSVPGKVPQPVGWVSCAREHPGRSHSHTFVVFHYAGFIRGDLPNEPIESHTEKMGSSFNRNEQSQHLT